jgi:hypothetical protein
VSKPLLLAGKSLPFHQLTPTEFENFVYVALLKVGPCHGFRMTQLTGRTGDGGFDADGVREKDKRLICVQAKRYELLSSPEVAAELAKVAMTSFLAGAVPIEHRFITSGSVRPVLTTALRDPKRTTLLAKALDCSQHDEFETLRKKVLAKGGDVHVIVRDYVTQLDEISVWDANQFDKHLSQVWSQLSDALERHFAVERVLLERPRPDFDESAYLDRLRRLNDLLPLRAVRAPLPPNVRGRDLIDPLASRASPDAGAESEMDAAAGLSQVKAGELWLLMGSGGAGKSTTSRVASRLAADRRQGEEHAPLPVYVPLGAYRGSLKELIHGQLHVKAGHWESLPGPFLLLCDGIGELSPKDASAVVAELAKFLERREGGVVLTMRLAGLGAPIEFPPIARTLRLLPFRFREIRKLAERHLKSDAQPMFLTELRRRFSAVASLFTVPFGISAVLDSFRTDGGFPATSRALVEGILSRRYEVNEKLLAARDAPERLPRSPLLAVARAVASGLRLRRGRTVAHREEVEVVVHEAVVAARGGFGADALEDEGALRALIAYEILLASPEGLYRFEHDIVAAYLCSDFLAKEWRQHIGLLESRALDEAWLLASGLVATDERNDFFAKLIDVDVVLAASAARECPAAASFVEAALLAREASAPAAGVRRSQTYTALAVLQTAPCLERLRATAQSGGANDVRDHAVRALCIAGDRETLTRVLLKADAMLSPSLELSGGDVTLWELAPADAALEIARARIDEGERRRLGASLRALAAFGDATDCDRLLSVIEETSSVGIAVWAFDVLKDYDDNRAEAALRARGAASDWTVHVLFLEALTVNEQDAAWLANVVLNADSSTAAELANPLRHDAIVSVFERASLPADLRAALRSAYEGGDERLRNLLWRIASAQNLASFEPLAVDALESPLSREAFYAANFALTHTWENEGLEGEFRRRAIGAVEENWFAYDSQGWRLLEYLQQQHEHSVVASSIETQFRVAALPEPQLVAALNAVLERRGASAVAHFESLGLHHFLAGAVSMLLPLAVKVVDRLPPDVRVSLLAMDLAHYQSGELRGDLLRDIEPAQLDEALANITDAGRQIDAACVLLRIGTTPARLDILGRALAACIDHLPRLSRLLKTVEIAWSDDVLAVLVKALAEAPPSTAREMARDSILTPIAHRVTREQAANLVQPVLSSAQGAMREILQFWYDVAQLRASGA